MQKGSYGSGKKYNSCKMGIQAKGSLGTSVTLRKNDFMQYKNGCFSAKTQ